MGEKIVVGPINKGIRTDREPFNIDNDSFPVLQNAYQWRGRIKRKRGTTFLNRLQRHFDSTKASYTDTNPPNNSYTITFDGDGNSNLLGPYTNGASQTFSLEPNGNIIPGSVTIVGSVGTITYTDPTKDGYLTPTGTGGPNTINYGTGAILIPAQAGGTATVKMRYFPVLPVMGLEDLILNANEFHGNLAFDTTYSYNMVNSTPFPIYDVSFYKNPPANSTTLPGYTPKTDVTPTSWFGQDYQQFWTVNYQGALWATNGINVPFVTTNIGMHYRKILQVTMIVPGPPATARLTLDVTLTPHNLVKGDFLFINEVPIGTVTGINFQTGYVISNDPQNVNYVDVEFPNATLGGAGGAVSSGIAQYLTNRVTITNMGAPVEKDVLRWYDGDPTNGNFTNPSLTGNKGWVNFAPPLSQSAFSIADLPTAQYYLVGARLIVPFKDFLLFLGPVVQTSVGNDTSNNTSQIYLQDTIIYSQDGTPFYTCSYTNTPNPALDTPTSATNIFFPILVPVNQTATSPAYMEDSAGFGGNITAGFAQPILSANANEDVLIVGFSNRQTRLVYTGSNIVPFNFFITNSEYGTASTFSTTNLDRGVISVGSNGIIISSQIGSQRLDLDLPDQIFQFNLTNNGFERVTTQRDFINEWVYISYPDNEITYKYPNQTLQYNYRDNSWGIFIENYTAYGTFKRQDGQTWATLDPELTWEDWYETWNAGSSTILQPQVIAGNQQGFVVFRDNYTLEATSLEINSFTFPKTVTSPNHCLNNGDFIVISGAIGTISTWANGNIFQVANATVNQFDLIPGIDNPITAGTYFGGGVITRMYIPFIQTRQFPVSWAMSRKTRIGTQQYLFTKTDNGQITLQIYLSQNDSNPYNFGNIVPNSNVDNSTLIYSDIVYTCPESSNLGLTPANTNLQMPTASQQSQIWHRMNTSLIGDTVQLGFTLSPDQMRDTNFNNQFVEIELHSFVLDVTPSQVLS